MKAAVLASLVIGLLACGKVKGDPGDDGPDASEDPCAAPNVCECLAASEDTDCGTHEYCETGGPGRTCECVAGYTRGTGTGCVFTGTLQDPGFAAATNPPWTVANGALLNSTAVGGIDPGEATYLPSALCGLAHVKQTVDMPSFRKAEPLVLVLSYKNEFNFMQFDRVSMGVSLGGGWFPLPNFFDALFHTTRICLPEGGFAPAATTGRGAPVTFAFGPYEKPIRCPNSSVNNFAVDHVSIVLANPGECSAVQGQGINFDAESTGGWTFTTTGSSTSGFGNGIGAGGTKAAFVTLGARCDSAFMTTQFNVPLVANPAFEMFMGSNVGANASVDFGDGLFQLSVPSGSSTTVRTCLPPSLRGQAMNLRFSLNGGSGLCAQILNHQVFADNVRVVDDPACAAVTNFSNVGFEQGGVAFGSFASVSTSTSAATVKNTAGQAHSGTRFLAVESFGRCTSSGLRMLPTVPAAVGANGPAITFFANVGVNPDASTNVFTNGVSTVLVEGGGYQKRTVCLDPLFIGRPQPVTISHNGGSGLCDNSNYVVQSVLVDTIEVTNDPICPAQ